MNVFIVDDDPTAVVGLRGFLDRRFDGKLSISTFSSGERAIKEVDKDTGIVLLNYDMPGTDVDEVMQAIKRNNAKTEVIRLGSNEEVVLAIEAFQTAPFSMVGKRLATSGRVFKHLHAFVGYPIRVLTREFKIKKYLAILLMLFLSMGVFTMIALMLNRFL